MYRHSFAFATVALTLIAGCGDDASSATDSGTSRDASSATDSGTSPDDAGAPMDAARPPRDAGPPLDAAGVVACADATDPSLTDAERMLIAMAADTWTSIAGSDFSTFCHAHEVAGVAGYEGCDAVINDWSGGAWDPLDRKMLLWGGGHHGYLGNEVYAFDVATMSWELLSTPTPLSGEGDIAGDPLADGNPVSRHTYDALSFLTSTGELFAYGGSSAPNGYSVQTTWRFSVSDRTWRQADPGATLHSAGAGHFNMGSDYDPVTNKVWVRDAYGVHDYDVATDRWHMWIDGGYPPFWPMWATYGYKRGVVRAASRIFYSFGNVTDGHMDQYAWNMDTHEQVPFTTTGGDTVFGRGGAGVDYDSAVDEILAWSGGAPWALDLTTNAWTELGGADAPAATVGNGTFGRFRYLTRYNVFILVNEPAEPVFFYKHTPGCGN